MNTLAVAYYPEHVAEAQWAHDLQRMLNGGVTAVRILEFAWGRLEPRDGEFTLDWVRRFMDLSRQMGMNVVPCTPTAAQPPWMIVHCPETTCHHAQTPGARRQYCFSSPRFREFGVRVTRQLIAVMASYDNVIGWQIDNELGFNFCQCAHCLQTYQEWLHARFHGDLDALNAAWGLVFWSAEYNDWGDIRFGMTAPEAKLAEKRFFSDLVIDFLRGFVDLLHAEHPGVPITTNFMANFEQIDYLQARQLVDVAAYDSYYNFHTLESLSMGNDLFRCLKRQPFWTLENGVDPDHPTGLIALLALKAWAHGEVLHTFFPWRAFNFGAEQVMGGLVDHADRTTRAYTASQQLQETYRQLPTLTMDDFTAQVAMVYSYENYWLHQSLPHYPEYFFVLESYYKSLNRLGLCIDVVGEAADFSSYKVVVFPPYPIINDGLADKIRAFVAAGGIVIAAPKSFTHTAYGNWQQMVHPAGLTDVFGASVREGHWAKNYLTNDSSCLGWDVLSATELAPPEMHAYPLRSDVPGLDGQHGAKVFEWLDADGAEVWATYTDGMYAGQAALTAHPYGQGWAIYLGCGLPEEALRALYRHVLQRAVVPMAPAVHADVEVVPLARHRIYLNHTAQSVREPKPEGTVVLGETDGSELVLPPYGCAVVETVLVS